MRFDRHGYVLAPLLALAACAPVRDASDDDSSSLTAASVGHGLGATLDEQAGTITFHVYSERATRLEIWLYRTATGVTEVMRQELTADAASHVFSATLQVADVRAKVGAGAIFYGVRAWGPNWPFDPAWTPGSAAGFSEDVDAKGNRFNPNKLLIDPYALELSHDPLTPAHLSSEDYASGPAHRLTDTGPIAPKGVVLALPSSAPSTGPTRPFKDDVVYELHVRGFTMLDAAVPENERGTFAGAARRAKYLRELGVTAIELMPVHESQNDTNDVEASTAGDNYWGYATLGFFAPDRRLASDRSPGGPTREFRAMVEAFHAQGIKVLIDVVYNHTGEGGLWDNVGDTAMLLSWRGLDNHTYYQDIHGNYTGENGLVDHRHYWDNNGVAGNFNAARPIVRDQITDSLKYWHGAIGVDGFRFDLAPVVGNDCANGCFQFNKMNPDNVLNRSVRELPVRPSGGGAGVELIAEPWATNGVYEQGNFPSGWAEWNGKFRDTVRSVQNQLGVVGVRPAELATRIAGSSDLFQDDGRSPFHSVNFLTVHDGFTLRDLYACNGKSNGQAWPFGPSDGGEDNNRSWDQGGDAALQRQAARTGYALLLTAAGVPMLYAGDEVLRSQRCNNNAYNLDSSGNWIDWSDGGGGDARHFQTFTRRLLAFRAAHPALRRSAFFDGQDHDENGLNDITWLRDDGSEADGGYMQRDDAHFLAWRIDGSEAGDAAHSIYVAYNGWSGPVTATLPAPATGLRWRRFADTGAWMESGDNARADETSDVLAGTPYELKARSAVIFVER